MPQRAFARGQGDRRSEGRGFGGDTERVNRSIANIVEVNRGTQRLLRHSQNPLPSTGSSRRNASVCCIGLEMFERGNNSHYAKYITDNVFWYRLFPYL